MNEQNGSDVVARIVAAAEANADRQFGPELQQALGALVESPREYRPGLILELAQSIPRVESPVGAGLLAVWFGASVEGGLEPEPSTGPIVEALIGCARRIETDEEGEATAEPADELLDGMELLGQGLVAHLARSVSLRDQLAADSRVVDELARVEPYSVGAMWVGELLRRRSGELVVLHVESRSGFRVRFTEIANNFHLFTLLQAALAERFPGAGELAETTVAVARGETQADVHDTAWWHFGQPTVAEADLGASVWGEASPDTIGRIDGDAVLLLWPPVMAGRSWNAGFFGPPIAASAPDVTVVGELSGDDVNAWWERLGLPG